MAYLSVSPRSHPRGRTRNAYCRLAECTARHPCPRYRLAQPRTPAPLAPQADHQHVVSRKRRLGLTSGATYGRLPHLPLSSLVLPLCLNTAHSPKSDTFRFPLAAKSRFSGFRSRCAMPLSCRKDCHFSSLPPALSFLMTHNPGAHLGKVEFGKFFRHTHVRR